jgi:hypothetical protein
MLASSVAVAGLATKVAKSLDDLAGRWQNAELSLQSLKTTIASFNASLNSLSRWIEIEYQPEPSSLHGGLREVFVGLAD